MYTATSMNRKAIIGILFVHLKSINKRVLFILPSIEDNETVKNTCPAYYYSIYKVGY